MCSYHGTELFCIVLTQMSNIGGWKHPLIVLVLWLVGFLICLVCAAHLRPASGIPNLFADDNHIQVCVPIGSAQHIVYSTRQAACGERTNHIYIYMSYNIILGVFQ